MAIQNRRGLKKDFDPAKMLPGEFAVSIDSETENQIVWMCFAPGVVKRIGTYEDFEKYLDENCKTAYEYAVEGGYAGTEDEFKAKLAQECADAIVASASGAVIAVSDSAEQRLKRLLLHGKSTQDGTPSPSTQVDIVSAGKYNEATGKYEVEVRVSGRNLFDKSTVTPNAYVLDNSGDIKIPTSGASLYNVYSASDFISVAGLMTIRINQVLSSGNWGAFYDKDKNYISGIAVDDYRNGASVPDGAYYARLTVTNEALDTFAVNSGTEILTYEPYRPVQTVTLSLSEPIRSLPDGTSDIVHVDRATGTAWVERKTIKIVLDGSSDEKWVTGGTNGNDNLLRFLEYSHTNIIKSIPYGKKANVYCDQFIQKNTDEVYLRNEGIAIGSNCYFYIYDEAYSDKTLDEFKARLSANPITIIAELATPTTEELPEETVNQLLALTAYYPNTTITTDQGATIDVDYVADTKNYIDNLKTQHEADIQTLKTAIIALGGSV